MNSQNTQGNGISSANVWLASFYPITSTERIPSPSSLHEDPFTPPRQLTRGIRDFFVFIGSSGFLCEGRTMEGEEKKKKERSRTREKERKLRNRNRWKKECFRSLTGRGGKKSLSLTQPSQHSRCHTIELVDFFSRRKKQWSREFQWKIPPPCLRIIGYASLCGKNLSEIAYQSFDIILSSRTIKLLSIERRRDLVYNSMRWWDIYIDILIGFWNIRISFWN